MDRILKRADEIEIEITNGDRIRYRTRDQILAQKKQKLGKYPNTWFLRGDIQNTFKVQGTPNSRLKTALMKSQKSRIGADGGATNFIELGGKPVSSGLSNTELFTGQQGCFYPKKCMINPEANCRTQRLVYKVTCTACAEDPEKLDAHYYGTSGHTLHKRLSEHMSDLRSNQRSNAMVKHRENMHRGQEVKFMAEPVKGGIVYNVDRFILEAVHIDKNSRNPNVNLLNQRGEWGHTSLNRLHVRS